MLVDAGTLQFAVAPIIAVVVVCLLGLLLRWIFGTGRRARVPAATGAAGDHGLLRPVAMAPGRPEANAVRAVLSEAGIRSTLSVRGDGRVDVLVFPDDADRARRLVPPGR